MLRLAGLGVALHAKNIVQAEADIIINHCDLTSLLYIQGYHQDEFLH
jgi:phosphoserine phosphatase